LLRLLMVVGSVPVALADLVPLEAVLLIVLVVLLAVVTGL